jgi:hypothetical protein
MRLISVDFLTHPLGSSVRGGTMRLISVDFLTHPLGSSVRGGTMRWINVGFPHALYLIYDVS